MIWSSTFSDRLTDWNLLRDQCVDLSIESVLKHVNAWWFNAPWQPYFLHWDDRHSWPDPWRLLSDNVYCDVARGLGILYTITLLDNRNLAHVQLVLTENDDNLVLIDHGKYVLNWQADSIVNNNQFTSIKQQYQPDVKQQKI